MNSEERTTSYYQPCHSPIASFVVVQAPETVIEVFTTDDYDFTEERITVKGKLRLNADDPTQLMYVMNAAEVID